MISGSDSDRLPTVEQSYASRGSKVLHTAETGAVEARIRRGRISVAPWRRYRLPQASRDCLRRARKRATRQHFQPGCAWLQRRPKK